MKTTPLCNFRLRGQFAFALMLITFVAFAPRVRAFALLGPYADWMVATNGYDHGYDIGGPMDINEEYRWDVPVVTYAFDQSFVDYFGSNGVAAVESAIQILNDLPRSSDIVLSNFPPDTRGINFRSGGRYDLKSTALALLVEQMGLTQPVRNILDLRDWSPDVIQRNFDPETLAASKVVNGITYDGTLYTNGGLHDIVEFPLDAQASPNSAVADAFSYMYVGLPGGDFYSGLTSDDAGGFRYLLNATNVNWESLPKDVLFTGKERNANKRLRGAWRPGVEKITFVPQPVNKRGKFKTAILDFTAYYVTNGVTVPQPARRVVSRPDILFSAAETFQSDSNSPMFLRTGTSKWVNNAKANGNTNGAGPGVIIPPIKITFDKGGLGIYTGDGYNYSAGRSWASFDASTNPPVLYPQNTGQVHMLVRLHFYDTNTVPISEIKTTLFRAAVPFGKEASFEISTNQTDWISLATAVNDGSILGWNYFGTRMPISFRVVPTGL